MQLNEERVKLFATILRLLTNPEILKELGAKGEVIDYEGLVRCIAEMVPYPQMACPPFTLLPGPYTPVIPTIPSIPPSWEPQRPLVGDPLGWPTTPTTICANDTNGVTPKPFLSAMTQADGQGDDSGTRGD